MIFNCYYIRFVKQFLLADALLTRLTHKKNKLQRFKNYEKDFYEWNTRLTKAIILTMLEGLDNLIVYCDALKLGLGYVPM